MSDFPALLFPPIHLDFSSALTPIYSFLLLSTYFFLPFPIPSFSSLLTHYFITSFPYLKTSLSLISFSSFPIILFLFISFPPSSPSTHVSPPPSPPLFPVWKQQQWVALPWEPRFYDGYLFLPFCCKIYCNSVPFTELGGKEKKRIESWGRKKFCLSHKDFIPMMFNFLLYFIFPKYSVFLQYFTNLLENGQRNTKLIGQIPRGFRRNDAEPEPLPRSSFGSDSGSAYRKCNTIGKILDFFTEL